MKRPHETFSQALVGLFMIAVLLLLGYFTIVISGVDVLAGRHRVEVKIDFDHVGGLKERDNVMYRGTKVGIIERVEVTSSNLIVVASVDDRIVLRESARASVCNLSMLGGYYLKLEEGLGAPRDLVTTRFAGESPTDWMQDVANIARNLSAFSERPELKSTLTNVNAMVARARAIAEKADAVMDRISRGEGTVGKLLSTNETVYADVRETAAGAKEMVARATQAFDTATKAFDNVTSITDSLKDEQLLTDLKAGIAAFRKAAEGLDARDVLATAKDLAENLNAVALKVRNGEGTLGKLTNESEMYTELNALIKECRQVLDNYRDTTPISTFSSLATGAL